MYLTTHSANNISLVPGSNLQDRQQHHQSTAEHYVVCGVCVVDGWLEQPHLKRPHLERPHLARGRRTALGLGEAAHLWGVGPIETQDKPSITRHAHGTELLRLCLCLSVSG